MYSRRLIRSFFVLFLFAFSFVSLCFAQSNDGSPLPEPLNDNEFLIQPVPVTTPIEVIRQPGATDETNTIITIGTGTTNQTHPLYGYYKNSFGAAIYTAEEIGTPGVINMVALYAGTGSTWTSSSASFDSWPDTLEIWLAEVTDAVFATASNFPTIISTPGAVQVYNAIQPDAPIVVSTGWNTFPLITPFNYTGSGNLLVVWRHGQNYQTVSTSNQWNYSATPTRQYQYYYNNTWSTFMTNTANLSYNRPNFQFDITISLTQPGAVTLNSPVNGVFVAPPTAALSWTTGANTNNVDVYCSTNQSDVATLNSTARIADAITSNTFNAAIVANRTYYWRVVARNALTNELTPSSIQSFNTYVQLSGVYTLGGTNPDFPDFASAITAMQIGGVGNGGVVFDVRPGFYNEAVLLPNNLLNVNENNPVTFRKESNEVTLSAPATTAGTEYIVKVAGADWITFDGISIQDTSTGTGYLEYGFWITNASATDGAQHITIKNSSITLRAQATSYGIRQSSAVTPTSTAGTQSFNKYLNLRVGKCYHGVYLSGGSGTYRDTGNEVGSEVVGVDNPNRMIVGQDSIVGSYGIYNANQEDVIIHDLDITNHHVVNMTSYDIYLTTQYGTPRIYNNRLHNSIARSTSNTRYSRDGIYVTTTTPTAVRIYNNMFYGSKSYSMNPVPDAFAHVYDTYISSVSTVYIDNNSYYNDITNPNNDLSNSECILINGGTSVNLRNNIFYNNSITPETDTSSHYAIYRQAGTITSSDYNVFYIPHPERGHIGYFTGNQTSLSDWQTATGMDAHSIVADPNFINTGPEFNLHISTSAVSLVNNAGTIVDWIANDIDGETRLATPDIGADEGNFNGVSLTFNPASVDYGMIEVGGTPGTQTVYVRNPGTSAITVNGVVAPAHVVPSWTTMTINPGDSTALVVTWTPVAADTLNDSVFVTITGGATFYFAVIGTAIVPASIPENLIAVREGSSIVLNWSASTGTVSGYRVYRYETGYFSPPVTGTLIGTTVNTTYTDPEIVTGLEVQYYYRVTAFNN